MTEDLTPMMRQYRRIKSELPEDTVLFFRLGDFYEMFFDDARTVAPILDIALTQRNGVPMCGVPYHACSSYLSRVIKAGIKVAICDQMENPAAAKGIVRREVTRIVTPGAIVEDGVLEPDAHNFLATLCAADGRFGIAFADISTGLFVGEEADRASAVRDVLERVGPREMVVASNQRQSPELKAALEAFPAERITVVDEWFFEFDAAYDTLTRHLRVRSLDGHGCEGRGALVRAAGAVVAYVRDTLRADISHMRSFTVRAASDFLQIDEATSNNLDLVSSRGKERRHTLLGVLDATRTPMGARLLRDWTLRPLARRERIEERHDAVAFFTGNRALLTEMRETLGRVRDMERLIARIAAGTGAARDVAALASSLAAIPALRAGLEPYSGVAETRLLAPLAQRLQPLPELVETIGRAIVDEPPAMLRDGGVIRQGFHVELDALRSASSEGRQWLARYQAEEQERTGIRTLKIRHNKVFGYYIEISKGQLALVPDSYTRKQTLVNAERFITPELKQYEDRVVGANEKAVALEIELFEQLRGAVVEHAEAIQTTSRAVAELDALGTLADRALVFRYVRPAMTDDNTLLIKGGRHPVIERIPDAERFVPNDTQLDGASRQIAIITGPNMAGKSTYIRQVALIAIMAHMGSFVPADEARVGLLDRVFTRVGASDDLARGRSTFMVEMQETANILNNATARSLIVLDEIGRGTSTFDGISIAWSVAEYLHNHPHVKAKTLFATHYHELTDLARALDGIRNYNIQVREKDDNIVFLRRIAEGGADKSYGIQVARLAGMPDEVIERAREILANLEEGELGEGGQPNLARTRTTRKKRNEKALRQLTLFD